MLLSRVVSVLPVVLAAAFASGAAAQLKLPSESSRSGSGLAPSAVTPAAPTAPAEPTAPRAPSAAPAASAAGNTPAAPSAEIAQKENAGRLAATGWLSLLDRKDWGTAWESSAGMFRSTVPLATWMDGIPKVRAPLGKLVERTAAGTAYKTELPGRPPGEYVSVKFTTRFDQQQVEEIVTTVREPDGRWRVTGYSASR